MLRVPQTHRRHVLGEWGRVFGFSVFHPFSVCRRDDSAVYICKLSVWVFAGRGCGGGLRVGVSSLSTFEFPNPSRIFITA